MCLGVPGRISAVWEESGTAMAQVDFPGESKKVCLAYLPDLQVGEYTVVHAGFALNRMDEATALITLKTMRDFGIFADAAPDSMNGQGGSE